MPLVVPQMKAVSASNKHKYAEITQQPFIISHGLSLNYCSLDRFLSVL